MTRDRRSDDRGAVAVLVGLLAVVLVGMSAFTVDLGMAYVSKRQLQTASDAAALAAASVYTQKWGSCVTLRLDNTAKAQAQAAADAIREQNRPGSTGSELVVECGDTGALEVAYESKGATEVILGGVLGATDEEITTSREAAASVDVPPQVGSGLRPYMVCSDFVPGGTLPSAVIKVGFPDAGKASTACPTGTSPGNWWTVSCPENVGKNSTDELAEATLNGCREPVSIVSPQSPPTAPPNDTLRNELLAGCSGGPDHDCLGAVPGAISGAQVWAAWSSLLGKTVVLPVFCGEATCSPAAVVQAGGDNAAYPVHKFVGATVCGYHWGSSSQKTGQTTAGACGSTAYDATDGGNDENYLLLVYSQVRTSGTTGPSACALGDSACDGGLRRVRLTK
jgi:hypothetical protein